MCDSVCGGGGVCVCVCVCVCVMVLCVHVKSPLNWFSTSSRLEVLF